VFRKLNRRYTWKIRK